MSDRPNMDKLRELLHNTAALKQAGVRVGIPRENNVRKDGLEMGNAGLMQLHEYGGTVHVPERTGSITRRIRADGTFAYNGRFRKKEIFSHSIGSLPTPSQSRNVLFFVTHSTRIIISVKKWQSAQRRY